MARTNYSIGLFGPIFSFPLEKNDILIRIIRLEISISFQFKSCEFTWCTKVCIEDDGDGFERSSLENSSDNG